MKRNLALERLVTGLWVFTASFMVLTNVVAQESKPDNPPQGNMTLLNRTIDLIEVKEGNLADLVRALRAKGVPVSAEYIVRELKPLTISKQNTIVKEILDQVCEAQGYKYEERAGLINIIPSRAINLGEEYPLNRRVASLKIEKKTIPQAIHILGKSSGVFLILYDFPHPELKPPVSLDIKNVTVREALNEIVKAGGMKCWTGSLSESKNAKGEQSYLIGLLISG